MGRLLLGIAGIYGLVVLLMYAGQRQLEYFPDTRPPGAPRDSGVPEMREVTVKTDDGLSLVAWFAPPKKKDGRIVVMFHGNGGNIAERAGKARNFLGRGYGVYMAEYRGYGGNAGSPTEEGLYRDARAGLKWLEGQGFSPAQFVIYGESIGTGVAVQMASEIKPNILILEAPFSSAAAVGQANYFWLPVAFLMKDKFDSIAKIGAISPALLIVHGDRDNIVPIRFSRDLFAAANDPKKFVTIGGGGHGDLYSRGAGPLIADWLDGQP